jgi:hypothetical protein
MAIRLPLIVISGQLQQLPAGDTVDDPAIGSYAPGSFALAAGQFALMAKRLTLTSSQRATLAGDSCLRIN